MDEKLKLEIFNYLISKEVEYIYGSYDFHKAFEDFVNSNKIYTNSDMFENFKNHYNIPMVYKLKYRLLRKGKIRTITFKDSKIYKFQIGNKRYKTYYLKDLFIEFRPIISKEDDIFDLISQGLAIEKHNKINIK